jgi:hypothetical protein
LPAVNNGSQNGIHRHRR